MPTVMVSILSWGERRGLNPRHSVPQTDALPAELRPPRHFVHAFNKRAEQQG
jgi:hypothetical protein